MPWHVIVYQCKRKAGDPWLLVDEVFRNKNYRDEDGLIKAVSQREAELRSAYPPPDYTVRSGHGPESSSSQFKAFVVWLLRDD